MPSPPAPAGGATRGAAFPDTQTSVLAQAAGGDWEPFFREYLAPCWREIAIACRGRIPVGDIPDLFQELTLRLLKMGESRPEGEAAPIRGNIPHRYLARKQLGIPSAKFRTYLKQVIGNLIREQSRANRRQAKSQDPAALEPAVEDSISKAVDRHWVAACLFDAAARFHGECAAARTKARQRQFDLLYEATVRGATPADLARTLGLHRTTVTAELGEARERFVARLAKLSGIADRDELKRLVAADPEQLFDALKRARTGTR
jgi:DNA-directed RNA polymerase specialized sigma24 family protein